MKKEDNNLNENAALARYLSGEMSQAEALEFEVTQAAHSDATQSETDRLKAQWASIGSTEDLKSPNTTKAWEKLNFRLQTENLVPAQSGSGKRSFTSGILKAAALILILFSVGLLMYQNSKNTSLTEKISIITVNESNTLVKTLNDGSIVYLAHNSEFSFPAEFESGSRKVELKGEAFFDIAPDAVKPFIIETKGFLVQVLGTAFNVKSGKDSDFKLAVDRGKVKVMPVNKESNGIFVTAGEQIILSAKGLEKSKYTIRESEKWYKQRMHFKDETLQNIINVLNRNFNTKFAVADKATGNRILTVTFQSESTETMTELICVTLNLKSQIVDGSVILSEKESASQNQ